jgi:hypothetical protein
MLVSVEGNTYLSVPILDFGSERDQEIGSGEARMPGLSAMYPLGNTSTLTRFVIGIDEALRNYQGAEEARRLNVERSSDPWNEDLFYRRLPVKPPVVRQESGDTTKNGSPAAMTADPHRGSVGGDGDPSARLAADRPRDVVVRSSSATTRILAAIKVLAGIFLTALLAPPDLDRSREKRNRAVAWSRAKRASDLER